MLPALRLLSIAAIVCCSSCDTGHSPGPTGLQTVLFDRNNTFGGTDLYRAPIDGGSEPVNITRHSFQQVVTVWRELVAGRVLYTARTDIGTVSFDFYSTSASEAPGETPAFTRLTDQAFAGIDDAAWAVVGDRLVYLATSSGADNLYSVSVRGGEIARLTQFTSGTIHWPRSIVEPGDGVPANSVTQGGRIVFEQTTAGQTAVYSVRADGADAKEKRLSTAEQSMVAIDPFDVPMVFEERVIVRETSSNGVGFRVVDAATSANRSLTPLLTPFQDIEDQVVFAGHFVYLLSDTSTDVQSIYSIDLTGPVAQNGQPAVRLLTPGLLQSGTEVVDFELVPDANRIAFVAEQPGSAPNKVFSDVYSVELGNPTSLVRCTMPQNVDADDITDLTISRTTAFFRRASTGKVSVARLLVGNSDMDALVVQDLTPVAIDDVVYDNPRFSPVTGELLTPVVERRIDRVILTARAGGFTDFYSVEPTVNGVEILKLSQASIPDGAAPTEVELNKGQRLVYLRDGRPFSCNYTIAQSEIPIGGFNVTASDILTKDGQGAAEFGFLVANGSLFSVRLDVPSTDSRSIRQLSELPIGRTVQQILLNTDTRVVYVVAGLGATEIYSSPVAPAQPTMDRVSRAASLEDRFVLAF